MGTFFEKLTGAKPAPAIPSSDVAAEPAKESSRPVKKPAPARAAEKQATHLRVESDDTAPAPQEETAEEEGELTVDIYDRGDAIIIQSTVAGVKPEDLDVSITSDSVTIRGKRQQQEEIEEKNYYYKELFWGTFSRSVILPEEIDDEAAEATLKHGLLSILLPKKKRGVVQKLKVKVT